jgi:multidrug efflux system membrane fusion protein
MRREPIDARCALFALSVLAACGSGGNESAPGARPAVPVRVATVGQRDVPEQVRAIGNVEAYSTVSVKTLVEGQLARVGFAEGQEVHRDDLLFTIDPRPFEAALRQAEATLARDIAQARKAELDAGRMARLIREGIVSIEENDRARAATQALAATVKADEAAVEDARLRLGYCYLRSPIDGRIGALLVHEGNVVKDNETVLAVINQVRPVQVSFAVPEAHLPAIQRRMSEGTLRVEASVPGDGAAPVVGELRFVNNAVDTTTGTVLLKGLFANAEERLWPGQFVRVALTLTTRQDAVVAPAAAIQTGQEGSYAFVVKPDLTVESRPITVGPAVDQEVVIERGLAPGEHVVTDGQVRLAPGAAVQLKDGAAP